MKSLIATTAFFIASTLSAQIPTAAALAKQVDDHYNRLHTLQARYTQHYQGMGLDRTETGTLTLRKPGRMRWAYDTPVGKVFVLDGKNAIAYTPGDTQAQSISAKKLDDLRSPLRFLLGHTDLLKELDGLSVAPAEGGYIFSGVPRGMASRVRSLALTVDASGVILGLRLEEVDGASTTFSFTNIHENIPTRDSDFAFLPPPGVEVVTGPPPI